MFVLQRSDDGKYVAAEGSEQSYTDKLQRARVFMTRADAVKDACGNERVIELTEAMEGDLRRR